MPTVLIGTQWRAYGEQEENDNVDDDDDNDDGTELLIMIPGWKEFWAQRCANKDWLTDWMNE